MQMLFEAPGYVRGPRLTMDQLMGMSPEKRKEIGGDRIRIEDLPADDAVIGVLQRAVATKQKVLVTGHVEPSPDGDAIGSTLALVRTLRALGVDARACFATDRIRGELRGIAREHELVALEDLKKEGFAPDLVVLSDVADQHQIGGVAELMKSASEVAVIDHHDVDPTSESLGLSSEQQLHRWIYSSGDSAAAMTGALIAQLLKDHPPHERDAILAEAAFPIVAGILTDTRFGTGQQISQLSLHLSRDLIDRFLGGDLEEIKSRFRYQLPPEAESLLLGDQGLGTRRNIKIMGVFLDVSTIPHTVFSEAYTLTKKQDPKALPEDLMGPILDELDLQSFATASPHVRALLMEADAPGEISMSLRATRPFLASSVAAILGGGGKKHSAGARRKESLDTAERKLSEALRQSLTTSLKSQAW